MKLEKIEPKPDYYDFDLKMNHEDAWFFDHRSCTHQIELLVNNKYDLVLFIQKEDEFDEFFKIVESITEEIIYIENTNKKLLELEGIVSKAIDNAGIEYRENDKFSGGMINWNRLRCEEATFSLSSNMKPYYSVFIRGADRRYLDLKVFIIQYLEEHEFPQVQVNTEW